MVEEESRASLIFKNQIVLTYLILNTFLLSLLFRSQHEAFLMIGLTFCLGFASCIFLNKASTEQDEVKDFIICIGLGCLTFFACCILFQNIVYEIWGSFVDEIASLRMEVWELKTALCSIDQPVMMVRDKETEFKILCYSKAAQSLLCQSSSDKPDPLNSKSLFLVSYTKIYKTAGIKYPMTDLLSSLKSTSSSDGLSVSDILTYMKEAPGK